MIDDDNDNNYNDDEIGWRKRTRKGTKGDISSVIIIHTLVPQATKEM